MKKSLEQISLPAKKVWRQFEEARKFARSLNLRGTEEWHQYCKSNKKPDDIPSSPDIIYKNDGWRGMGDWLGTGSIAPQNRVYLSFKEAREFARSLNLKNFTEWIEYCRFGKDGMSRPNDIPAIPGRTYKNDGWISIPDWLGNEPMKGKKRSEESKRKQSEAMKGKKHSEETRRKLSEAKKRENLSEETLRKRSEALKGRKFSDETKKKMSEAWKDREPVSEETKQKMSEAQKARRNQESLGMNQYYEERLYFPQSSNNFIMLSALS